LGRQDAASRPTALWRTLESGTTRAGARTAILVVFNQTLLDRTLELSDDLTSDQETLQLRLNELLSEHRDLDDVIARITDEQPFDQLQVQRLKKRKLGLKDEILLIENELLPDIIA
jgi:hypothetical protein